MLKSKILKYNTNKFSAITYTLPLFFLSRNYSNIKEVNKFNSKTLNSKKSKNSHQAAFNFVHKNQIEKLNVLKIRFAKYNKRRLGRTYQKRSNSLSVVIKAIQKSLFIKRKGMVKKIPYNTGLKKKWQIRKQEIAHLLYKFAINRWTKLPQKRSLALLSYMNKNNEFRTILPLNVLANTRRRWAEPLEKYKTKLKFTKKLKKKYNNLKNLKQKIFSKISTKSYVRPTKHKTKTKPLTMRQAWLSSRYTWLQKKIVMNYSKANKTAAIERAQNPKKNLKMKPNVFARDFLKTYFGQHLLNAHKLSKSFYTQRWRPATKYNPKNPLSKTLLAVTGSVMRHTQKLTGIHKRGWLYNNLTFPKRLPYNFNKKAARKIYPYNIYLRYWTLQQKSPWLDPLEAKRALYSGFLTSNTRELKWKQKFTWIPNLQKKKPMWHKRNQLYARYTRLLFNSWTQGRIQKKKHTRIKVVLSKIILPFYGNIKMEQFNKIKNKARIKKSENLSKANMQLGYLESRLDVIIYRLNLAPNIFWARKLIKDGSVFVNSTTNGNAFEKMYAPLKKNVYPLKLRDPLNLYKKTIWSKFNSIHEDFMPEGECIVPSSKLNFLLEPMRNINYLTQPGDVILCAPSAVLNKHKTENILWTKIVPKHILTSSDLTETKKQIKKKTNLIKAFASPTQNVSTVSVILFKPTYDDLDTTDRVKSSFIRWLSL